MESLCEITKLCESWWESISDSTKVEQNRVARQFLEFLGWRDARPIESLPTSLHVSAASYILRGGAQSALAAHFVMPGLLEQPTSLVERGLDFCEVTDTLVRATRALHVDYGFITDLHRSFLYDARIDELLLYADAPGDFEREFETVLTRAEVERGSLEEIRREPRSYRGRQLREWSHRWCETLCADSGLSKDMAYLAIDRLLVIRYLLEHDILKRAGWRLGKRYSDLIAQAFGPNRHGCGKQLGALFHDIWFDWKAELFAVSPALAEALENDELAAALLREFALLSRNKFHIATILESFNYGKAAEKARVRLIPEDDEDRRTLLERQMPDSVDALTIEVDIRDEGYRAIFHWFDKLMALYERLDIEFDSQLRASGAMKEDLDLFAWSELDAKKPQALADKFEHVVERGLTIYCESPRQFRTARLMLHLHFISRYERSKHRFSRFPQIGAALKRRPQMLESDRRRLYAPAPEEDPWEGT